MSCGAWAISRNGRRSVSDTTLTPPEIAERYRVSPDKVLAWINRGELRAVNVAATLVGRPRWRISMADLLVFEQRRAAGPMVQVARRRERQAQGVTEYF
jgi:excisionase family DNA binding protein